VTLEITGSRPITLSHVQCCWLKSEAWYLRRRSGQVESRHSPVPGFQLVTNSDIALRSKATCIVRPPGDERRR
jgi:hypothetical protein